MGDKMMQLSFQARVPVFDANVRAGDTPDIPSPCRTPADLLAEMDRHGVQQALIYHAHAETVSPVAGNEQLLNWLDHSGRLVPQWVIMPTDDSMKQVQALHAQGRFSSVRLYNARAAGLPFQPWAYDTLLSWLGEAGIPLWIPLPDADAHELVTTLQAFPRVAAVLVGAHYTHALWVRPLLRALPNAYLELSRYEPIGEIEALRTEFGPERLIYGSWYSRYAMGPMLFYLHQTDLGDQELALVCAGNLDRVLRQAAGGRG